MSDRRRAERVALMQVTELAGVEAPVPATLLDISVTGVCFQTPCRFPDNTVVHIRIEYNPLDFNLRGVVMWTRPGSDDWISGAEFINVPPHLQIMLTDHVKELQAAILQRDPQAEILQFVDAWEDPDGAR